jgi:hypothetical protein
MVVGKKVKPDDGTVVVFEVAGPAGRQLAIGMDGGRANVLPSVPVAPAVRIRMSSEAYLRLSTGRGDAEQILGSGTVEVTGDAKLGFTVVRSMNFLF